MKIETDIAIIEKKAQQCERENWDFRCYLKGSDLSAAKIDSIVAELYREVSAQFDCTQCANCCKAIQPLLYEADVENWQVVLIRLSLYSRYVI